MNALVDLNSGNVVEKYSYDAFGKPTITDAMGNLRSTSAVGNRFMFQGREWISELGIYDYRHRFYHPLLGRFLQSDPMGLQTEGAKLTPEQKALYGAGAPEAFASSEMNLFRYCGDDPVDRNDPLGLEEDSKENLKKRAEIDRIARSNDGNEDYRKDVAKGPFEQGSNKCNQFTGDVTDQAGAPMRVRDADTGKSRRPSAGENADKTEAMKNWRILKANEAPKPGDTAAYPIRPATAGASGHTGIMISDGTGGVTNISAHADGVHTTPGQFINDPDTVYRRYIGD